MAADDALMIQTYTKTDNSSDAKTAGESTGGLIQEMITQTDRQHA